MEALKSESINVLPKTHWTSLEKMSRQIVKEKNESVSNATALITTALTDTFPELLTCSEKQFLRFQDTVSKIISTFRISN